MDVSTRGLRSTHLLGIRPAKHVRLHHKREVKYADRRPGSNFNRERRRGYES
jgi:hypothetical protein